MSTAQHKTSLDTRILAGLKRQRLAIFIGVGIGSLVYLGKYLSGLGEHGDHMAQVWGPSLSILGIISGTWLGILQLAQQKKTSVDAHTDTTAQERAKAAITPLNVIIAILIAALAFCLPIAFSRIAFDHWQKDIVTSQVSIQDASNMKDGNQAKVTLPSTKHSKLAITFTLDSLISTGSCVAPAKLTITPTHNGNDEPSLASFQSGAEQIVAMRKNTPTQLLVSVDLSEEPSCKVKLNITKAIYYQ